MQKIFILLIWFLSFPLAYGQEWQQVGDFNYPPTCFYSDTIDQFLYIGGPFVSVGADTMNSICKWDGQFFYAMGNPRKTSCGNVNCNPTNTIIRYHNEIYIGGTMDTINGKITNGIAKWDGITWSAVGDNSYPHTLTDYWVYASFIKDDKLYVTGGFPTAGADTCNSVAYWDGTNWSGMNFPSDFDGETPKNFGIVFYKGEWYVGGNCLNYINGNLNHDIARYDGISWKQVGSGLKGGFSFINDMVVYQDALYVCGYFRSIDGNAGNKIMRWDGDKWHDVAGGLCSPDDIATDMMVYEDKLYVVGIFDCSANNLPTSNVAVWNGVEWCSVGKSYFNNKILSITAWKGEIYVGGGFTEVGGHSVKYFAKYIGDHSTDTCSASVAVAPGLQQARQLLINPNPVKDQLTISASLDSPLPKAWRVFSSAGQEVTALVNSVGSSRVQQVLEVQKLPAGMYFLQGLGQTGMQIGRFVKM